MATHLTYADNATANHLAVFSGVNTLTALANAAGVLTNDGAGALTWGAGGSGGHVIQDEGTPLTARAALNFVGAGVTATDDAGNNATVVTIPTYALATPGTLTVSTTNNAAGAHTHAITSSANPGATASILASAPTTGLLTLAALTVTATITGSISGNAATVTTNANLTGPVTSVGNATSIANSSVTLAMMADMATASLIYRKTAGVGAPEVNTLATLKTDLGTMPPVSHDMITSHTYTGGAALDVFGLSGAGTIARLTPSNNPGAVASILASTSAGLLTLVNLNLSATSNQLVMQSAGVTGTITWTPTTSNKTITLPNLTGTVALGAGGLTATTTNDVTVAAHTHAIDSTIARSAVTVTGNGALGGGGALTGNQAITLNTPGTNSVSSTNNVGTNHTHAVTSSSAPGAAASLLATDASGSFSVGGSILSGGAVSSKYPGGARISLFNNGASGDFTMSLVPANLSMNQVITFPNYSETVAIGAGPLSVSSSRLLNGDHTHVITSSSAPGAAASLVATDASGNVSLAGQFKATVANSGYLPMVNYNALAAGMAVSTLFCGAAVGYACTVRRFASSMQVATTNNVSNYWLVRAYILGTGALIATLSTASDTANTWTYHESTGLSTALTTASLAVYVQAEKVGSPGLIYILGASIYVE